MYLVLVHDTIQYPRISYFDLQGTNQNISIILTKGHAEPGINMHVKVMTHGPVVVLSSYQELMYATCMDRGINLLTHYGPYVQCAHPSW